MAPGTVGGIGPGTGAVATPGGYTCGCSTFGLSSSGIGMGICCIVTGRLLKGVGVLAATPTGPRLTGKIITRSNIDASGMLAARCAAI